MTPFTQPIAFDIYFESVKNLKHSLTWRIIYIGQAANDEYDQVLEEAEMDCSPGGPKGPFGQYPFPFEWMAHAGSISNKGVFPVLK